MTNSNDLKSPSSRPISLYSPGLTPETPTQRHSLQFDANKANSMENNIFTPFKVSLPLEGTLTPLDKLALSPLEVLLRKMPKMTLEQESSLDHVMEMARQSLQDIPVCRGEFAKDSAQARSRAVSIVQKTDTIQGATCSLEYYLTYPLEHFDFEADWYRLHFANRDHRIYVGQATAFDGPVIITIKEEQLPGHTTSEDIMYRVIMRTKHNHDVRIVAPATQFNPSSMLRTLPTDKEIITQLFADVLGLNTRLVKISLEEKVQKSITTIDEVALFNRYKFGVLYCKAGQTKEEDMFGNGVYLTLSLANPILEVGSKGFHNFLNILGEKVELKGFQGYAAGLDTKTGLTGTHTVTTTWRDRFQITYHVSTMLPLDKNDSQKIQRKRHIGNGMRENISVGLTLKDIVAFVYSDGDLSKFDPASIKSHFLHVFILVSPGSDRNSWQVQVLHDPGIPAFGPLAPDPPIFKDVNTVKHYLLAKAINGENAAYHAAALQRLHRRTRDTLIDTFVEEEMGKEVKVTARNSIRIGKRTSVMSTEDSPSPRTKSLDLGSLASRSNSTKKQSTPPRPGGTNDLFVSDGRWSLGSTTMTGTLSSNLSSGSNVGMGGSMFFKTSNWLGKFRKGLGSMNVKSEDN